MRETVGKISLREVRDGSGTLVASGLVSNWHRFYDTDVGRYIRPDPLGLMAGLNPYAYALNDPINLSDPDGALPGYAAIRLRPKGPTAVTQSAARTTAKGEGIIAAAVLSAAGGAAAAAAGVGIGTVNSLSASVPSASALLAGTGNALRRTGSALRNLARRGWCKASHIGTAGSSGAKTPFNPCNGTENCMPSVVAFLKSVRDHKLFTAGVDFPYNGGSVQRVLNQIAEQTGAQFGWRQLNKLDTKHIKQIFVVFKGSNPHTSSHVLIGIVTKGKKLLYDPQIHKTYYNLRDFGAFTAYPLIFP